jgi:iron(III) transport system substrate-binding protein
MSRALLRAALAVALLIAGCGGSNDAESGDEAFASTLAAIEGLEGKARTDKLRELAAAQGGRLDVYSSMGAGTLDALTEAFGDLYDVDVAVYRADGDTILARLSEEVRAGYRGVDVVQINGLAMTTLHNEGLLRPYRSPAERNLIPGAVYDGWTAHNASQFAITWNTKLVSASERPRSWEDLADPRWKGQLGLEASDLDWYKTLRDYWIEEQGKSPAEADRLFDAIGRNAIVVHGHTVTGQLHAAGEFEVAVNYASTVDRLAREGAPLAWRPAVEPLVAQPQGMAPMGAARHPAAALLFVDWVLGEGQEILAEDQRDPVRKDLVVARSAKRIVIDFDSIAAEQERWTQAFERILGLGREAPD